MRHFSWPVVLIGISLLPTSYAACCKMCIDFGLLNIHSSLLITPPGELLEGGGVIFQKTSETGELLEGGVIRGNTVPVCHNRYERNSSKKQFILKSAKLLWPRGHKGSSHNLNLLPHPHFHFKGQALHYTTSKFKFLARKTATFKSKGGAFACLPINFRPFGAYHFSLGLSQATFLYHGIYKRCAAVYWHASSGFILFSRERVLVCILFIAAVFSCFSLRSQAVCYLS